MKRIGLFLAAISILFLILIFPSIAQTTSVNQFQTTASGDQQTGYILSLAGIFTFFFLMLGPIRVLVPFVKMTKDTDTRFRRKLALMATLISTIGCLAAAFVGQRAMKSLHISISADACGGNNSFLGSFTNDHAVVFIHSPGMKQHHPPRRSLWQFLHSLSPRLSPPME